MTLMSSISIAVAKQATTIVRTRLARSGLLTGSHGALRLKGQSASSAHDSSDEYSGTEVGAEHRPDLRAEQRPGSEDRGAPGYQVLGVLGALGVLHDPVLRAAVVQLIQVGAHPL